MDRRTLLKKGAMGAVGMGLVGCATPSGGPASGRGPLRLPPVRASWDRVIRTTVGLRPHRPSGFVLRADKLNDKMLIHNYGHGGSGMSLSWGTGQMAAEMALEHEQRRAAVIGCGAAGLTAARQLQRRGFRGHHLRHVRSAGHDVQHVPRGLHSDLGSCRRRQQDTSVGCPSSGGPPRSRTVNSTSWWGGGTECRGSIVTP